jgi:hypothetical protein
MDELQDRISKMSADDFKKLMEKAQTRKQFIDLLNTNSPDENSVEWVREKCAFLKQRLANLTPNRKDLRDSWNTMFDVDLFIQMFRHSAVEVNDANSIVNIVFDRIQMLCAPSQDEAVAHAKSTILSEKNTSKKLAILLEISNDIVDDIEKLVKNFSDGF